jgi:hypothetical protein
MEDMPLMQVLPFETISGNAYAYAQETTLPGAAFRALNSAYTESTGTITQKTETLAILGGDADVDRFVIQTRPGELANIRAEVTRSKAKAVRMTFLDTFVNGDTDSDANAFNGLKKRVTGTSQEISAATNGLAIVGSDDAARHTFLDKLDDLIALVPGSPDMLLMNDAVLSKIRSSARRLTIYDQTVDAFGRMVSTYRGIPLVDVGYKADGSTRVLPQTETQGSSSLTSSIYAIKMGRTPADRGITGLTNGGILVTDLGELETKPVLRTRIEFYVGLANHGDRAIARLKGVLAS